MNYFVFELVFISCLLLVSCVPVSDSEERDDEAGKKKFVNDYVKLLINHEFRRLCRTGDDTIGFPPLDPLTISEEKVEWRHDANHIFAAITDTEIKGLSFFSVRSVNIDEDNGELEIRLQVSCTINGNYELEGNVERVPINGEGNFEVQVEDLDVAIAALYAIENNGSKIALNGLNAELEFQSVWMNLEGLMGGGDRGKAANEFANRRLKHTLNQFVVPDLEEMFTVVLESFLDKALENFNVRNFAYGGYGASLSH